MSWSNDGVAYQETADRTLRVRVPIINEGRFPVTVRQAGRSGPGLELVAVDARDLPATLQPGDVVTVWLTYRLTDCAEAPREGWPVTVTVERFWGTQTVALRDRFWAAEWQVTTLDHWCSFDGQR